MDPKGRLSSQIHFLVPLGITYSDSLHCGNTLGQNSDIILSNLKNEPRCGTEGMCIIIDEKKKSDLGVNALF